MADLTGRHGIVAFQAGATWGTAVAPGALDGVLPFSISPWPLQGDPVIDDTVANWDEVQEMTKLIEEANPTIVYPYRREGPFLRHLAHIFGDDTPSGADPYIHTFTWQQESALFGTYACEIADADITEWPSMKTVGVTLRKGGDGGMEFEARTICDTVAIAGDATTAGGDFDAVTYQTKVKRVANNEIQFRINGQAGGALASPGDVIKLADFSLDINRPYDREDVTRGASTGPEFRTEQPIQNGPAEILLSITVNDYTTLALLDDLKDSTEYKADIIITKTISAIVHSDTIEFNRLQPMPQSADIDRMNRIPLTRVFRAKKATATPTGMTNALPIHWVHLDTNVLTYE